MLFASLLMFHSSTVKIYSPSPRLCNMPSFGFFTRASYKKLQESYTSETSQQGLKMISRIVPLGRPGLAQGSLKAVEFLASDEGSYLTEIEIFVDGGVAQV